MRLRCDPFAADIEPETKILGSLFHFVQQLIWQGHLVGGRK